MRLSKAGFTLIELLIAISIFALMGLAAHKMFRAITQADEQTTLHAEALQELQKASLLLRRDFTQIADRSIRAEYGDKALALTSNGSYTVELSHVGWRNPGGIQRSEIQRVAYAVKENKLVRYYWTVLDRSQDSKPQAQEILSGVQSFKIQYLDEEKQWRSDWPPISANNNSDTPVPLPQAVEITLTLDMYDTIRWLYVLNDPEMENETPG